MTSSDTKTLSPTRDARDRAAIRAPLLFLCLESHRPLAPAARLSLARIDEVTLGRGAARSFEHVASSGRSGRLSVRVDDAWMSTNHARIGKVLGRFTIEDSGSKNGTRVNGEPVTRAALADGDLIELGRTFFVFRDNLEVAPGDPPIVEVSANTAKAPGLATLLPSLARVYETLVILARAGLPVLVTGATGTGKEVTARAIHAMSERPGAYVAVNCGALPESLVEAELFGHRRGAFSDAKEDRPGLVRAADHGTLFLDEIGELRPPAQAALLRVLEEREVRPIGATAPVKVDVRFVSATNRGLERMVDAGTFRADLFHRLAGHRIELLPLRERREDLWLVAASLIERHAGPDAARARLHPSAARAMFEYGFPGNARELEKVLGAALALSAGGEITLEHLPPWARGEGGADEPPAPAEPPEKEGDDEPLREELVRLFREHKGNVSAVARVMGKARMQVQRWMKRYGIEAEAYKK